MKCPDCGTEDPNEFVYCTGCRRPRTWVSGSPAAVENGASLKVPPSGPSDAVPNARLVYLEGNMKGQEFPLTGRDISIGRQTDCDLVLQDQQVSRHHTGIRFLLGRYQIEDTGSTHGTWVNEARLTSPQFLGDRDIIRIGAVKLGFRSAGQAPARPVPAMPALMTIVEDVGHEPPAFDDTPRPFRGPEPPRPSAAPNRPIKSVRDELVEFERSLTPFIQRLEALDAAVIALTAQLAGEGSAMPKQPVPTDVLHRLAVELETEGGAERYRRLQPVLAELQSAPSDVRLLMRVSDELPAIIHLVEAYLRALDVLHEMDRA